MKKQSIGIESLKEMHSEFLEVADCVLKGDVKKQVMDNFTQFIDSNLGKKYYDSFSKLIIDNKLETDIFPNSFLSHRAPNCFIVNGVVILNEVKGNDKKWRPNNQIDSITQVIFSSTLVARDLFLGDKHIPFFKSYKTDPVESKYFFYCSRLPRFNFDEHVTYHEKLSNHVVIMYKGYFFKIDVVNDKNQIKSYEQIKKAILEILKIAENRQNNKLNPNFLQGFDRNEAAKLYGYMEKDTKNKRILELIANCSNIFCLDDEYDNSINNMEEVNFANNRWHDKTCFVFSKDNCVSYYLEETKIYGLGSALVVELITKTMDDIMTFYQPEVEKDGQIFVEELVFNIDDVLKDQIDIGRLKYMELKNEIDMASIDLNIGKNFFKTLKISSYSIIDHVYQLSYYSLFKEQPIQISAVGTKDKTGAYVTMHLPSTYKMKEFCFEWDKHLNFNKDSHDKSKNKELVSLLISSLKAHSDKTKVRRQKVGLFEFLNSIYYISNSENLILPDVIKSEFVERIMEYEFFLTSLNTVKGVNVGSFAFKKRSAMMAFLLNDNDINLMLSTFKSGIQIKDFTERLKFYFTKITEILKDSEITRSAKF